MEFPLPPKTRLLLAADGRRARLFFLRRGPTALAPAWDADLTVANRPNAETLSDKPSTVHERKGPARHGVGPSTPPHRTDELELARRAAEAARAVVLRDDVDEVYLVAAPRTLGDLREALDDVVRKRVVREADKDVSKLEPRELTEFVDRWLAS